MSTAPSPEHLMGTTWECNTEIAMQYHPHYLHAGHLGGGGVGAVCGEGDEAHVALGVAAVLEVSHDGHQTRILALQPGAQYLCGGCPYLWP